MRRRKGKADKGMTQREHFKKRMRERFGITVNRHDLRALKELVTSGQSTVVEKQSNRVTVHEIVWEGQTIHVCYDKQRGELVTALYPEGNPLCPRDKGIDTPWL